MDTTLTFEGGLDQDTAKLLRKQNTYYDASNIRITTYEGSSNIAVTNSKGNRSLATIPDIPAVYRVGTEVGMAGATVTINAIVLTTAVTVTTIALLHAAINANTAFTSVGFYSFLSEDETYLFVTSTIGTAITTFTVVPTAGTIVVTTEVPAQTNLKPIGHTMIRDECILLTTNETAQVPSATGGVGQIWKLTYDNITFTPTLTLLYNNYLNFTTFHPIPPSAIQGRYENSLTKRIYWTDNFNELRSFNTSGTNVFAIPPALLSARTPLAGSIPILSDIIAGSCKIGAYQACYRLKNNTSTTVWSEPSNITFLAKSNVAENLVATTPDADMNYLGDVVGTLSSKGIVWVIEGVDTNYARIEVLLIQRETYNGLPDYTIILDEPVVTSTFTFTYSGTESLEVITSTDFFNQSFSFSHCKTLTVKDNQLIAANVRTENTDFIYDARAYRFQPSTTAVTFADATSYPIATGAIASTEWDAIGETVDAVTATSIAPKYNRKYNSTTLGGTGKYISYEFGTYSTLADKEMNILLAGQTSPYIKTDQNYNIQSINLGVTDQDYEQRSSRDGTKFSYQSGLLEGYQRNETYRFGIVFYDKQYKALYARWIGDIKMPDYGDANSNPDAAALAQSPQILDFRLSFLDSGAYLPFTTGLSTRVQHLYIKFNVTIPQAVKEIVSGFRIVRVDRTKEDKTILGAGLINHMVSDGGAFFVPNPNSDAEPGQATGDLNITGTGTSTGDAPGANLMFDSPDFLLTGYAGFAAGDKLIVSQVFSRVNSNSYINPGGTDSYNISKFEPTYTNHSFDTNQYTVIEGNEVTASGSVATTASGAFTFNNWTRMSSSLVSSNDETAGVGSKTVALGLSSNPGNYACATNSGLKRYGLYYRPLASQYGGNTYSQRSNSQYIACGSFQPIGNDTSIASPFTHKVFGGDTFIDIYDNQKILMVYSSSNYTVTPFLSPSTATNTRTSFTCMFPCESSHNFNLRHGTRINKDLFKNSGVSGDGYGASVTETYEYNTIYSQVNNLVSYIVKPLDFVAIEEFDTRIWVSEQKQAGETADSWGIFLPAKYYDADTFYGPVNCILTFQDRVYFFQDSGYGVVPISERALQVDPNNSTELQMGKAADAIQRPEYISRTIGSKHQWSITTSDFAIYFFDINSKQLMKHNHQGPQAIEGLNGYYKTNLTGKVLVTDNPVHTDATILRNGIHCTTDFVTNDVYYTFFDGHSTNGTTYTQFAKTLIYNEDVQKYVSFMSFTPTLYINTHRDVITPYITNQAALYIHNKGAYGSFYGVITDSFISMIVNDNPKYSKVFTNVDWETEILNVSGTDPINILTDTWNKARFYNDYQITGNAVTLTSGTNIKRKERTWHMAVPRNVLPSTGTNLDRFDTASYNPARLFKEPLRDKHMFIELYYSNTNGRRLICPLVTCRYLLSPR